MNNVLPFVSRNLNFLVEEFKSSVVLNLINGVFFPKDCLHTMTKALFVFKCKNR